MAYAPQGVEEAKKKKKYIKIKLEIKILPN